jgi:hypothetical protein
MKLKCSRASASEAGGEMFQVLFEANPEQEDGPYVLIQRAWLEEDDRAAPPYYLETHDERLVGHYATLEVELAGKHLILQLPPPESETIEIDFTASDVSFSEIQHVLGIILQRDLEQDARKNAD